ncbi:unnamed protein product [Gongylonema pulchrum]|uniref:BHLH domain-containing protein n=1 Tax=Gongylonema pulchrum TaxID=637853 RepID=A0A183E6U4_9BILA|nr:unnamed protein product [Gongylonema pulchrum]
MEERGGDDDNAEYNRKRTLDRRRETSRFAARDRRGKEADIFSHLKKVVPLANTRMVAHVDRIALLRVASTYCKLRKIAAKMLKGESCKDDWKYWHEKTIIESLDGFVAIVDSNGLILYVSESVSLYLGLSQTFIA